MKCKLFFIRVCNFQIRKITMIGNKKKAIQSTRLKCHLKLQSYTVYYKNLMKLWNVNR